MKTILSVILALALLTCALPALGETATEIELNGTTAVIRGSGATVEDALVTISAAGTYLLTGSLEDGQILVDADKQDKVILQLGGVTLTNSAAPCVYVAQCDKTIIELIAGSENLLVSGTELPDAPDTEASGAALQAKDDLKIRGEGKLTVYGYLNNGIQTSNDLTVEGGEITVVAANNGVKGKDSLSVAGGTLSVRALGDGLTSDGPVEILDGVISITTDGGSAQTASAAAQAPDGDMVPGGMQFRGGDMETGKDMTPGAGNAPGNMPAQEAAPDATTAATIDNRGAMKGGFVGGMKDGMNWDGKNGRGDEGNPAKDESAHSAKGIKSGESITVSGGVVAIDARDDGLHAVTVTVSGGEISVSSADDAIHADDTLTVSGGSITVPTSYEALEGKNVLISGGDIDVYATDDGINAADGSETSAVPGRMMSAGEDAPRIEISGGNVTVIAEVDGLDANGSVFISGGNILVRGDNQSFDGAIDVDVSAVITGGTLLAIGGGSGFSGDTSQCVFSVSFQSTVTAGETLTIAQADGTQIYSVQLPRDVSMLTFSAPSLAVGESYTVTAGNQTAQVNQTALTTGSMNGAGGFSRGGIMGGMRR